LSFPLIVTFIIIIYKAFVSFVIIKFIIFIEYYIGFIVVL